MAPVEFISSHPTPGGTLSTAGGTSQLHQNAFGGPPEPISDGDQVYDRDDSTLDRQARNPGLTRTSRDTERQGFRFFRFLANLRR